MMVFSIRLRGAIIPSLLLQFLYRLHCTHCSNTTNSGSDSIDLANIQDEVRQLFREGEIVIYDKDRDDINKMCSYHLYKVNAQAFFEEILYCEDQPIGVIAYYFSEPLSEQAYKMIKTSPTIYYCKEEVVNILTPEPTWFKKILSFVF
jgi:hypothetical protein